MSTPQLRVALDVMLSKRNIVLIGICMLTFLLTMQFIVLYCCNVSAYGLLMQGQESVRCMSYAMY